MATSYKTPGVYIEEISKFPPSIAEVETAIPAFIGYTQMASNQGQNLINIPTKISSLLEYETYYGDANAPTSITVKTDENNNRAVLSVAIDSGKRFYMHDAVRMFYDNGGGDCYIVAVGLYQTSGSLTTIALGDPGNPSTHPGFLVGLDAVEKEDEPTILLFPDAVALGATSDFYSLQQAALMQCANLQSRVAILDLYNTASPTDPVVDFRNNIGINDLNYGMAYTPWLYSAYTAEIDYGMFKSGVQNSDGSAVTNLATLTTDSTLNVLVKNLEASLADVTSVNSTINSTIAASAFPTATTLDDVYKQYADATTNATGDPAIKTALKTQIDWVRTMALGLRTAWNNTTYFKNVMLNNDVASYALSNSLWKGGVTNLISIELNSVVETLSTETSANVNTFYTDTSWIGSLGSITASATDYTSAGSDVSDESKIIILDLNAAYNKISAFVNTILNSAENYASLAQSTLYQNHPIIGNIVANIQKEMSKIPPSGAMAGIYARVDAARGVWKAPANESINSVVGPISAISNDQQAGLNVDPIAGKSINAIRAFTGKGTLVWGARTLAGNDNDWRYINVRRFSIMVEMSSKNAAGSFVFEPNDANTWAKVQGMLENFLTLQWRAGALQGSKASDAFYVSVGLNKTMSALDILEGRMIVEIGMAIVRPAEFIILRFSQLMAQS
ncbi:MAG TPA: phage tail sheath C-terminal domain-containing protein [Flavipsychrobacter sp.]|nr:phage tail sheath C-terminal domain-containing protein [Flavipsychrobacter sp.]